MKWFKHISTSRRDRDIFAAREVFGGDAVDIFWSTVEMLAEEYKGSDSISGSPSFFKQHIPGHSWSKILKVWEFFGEESREKRRIIVEINGDMVTVSVPKLKELSDPYSKVLSRNNRSNKAETKQKSAQQEVEEEGEKKKPKGNGKPPVPQEVVDTVIAYLNKKTGKRYNPNVDANKEVISARYNEGHTVADFKAAIDNQCREWLGNPEYEKYLRPFTLFGKQKFEGYVNNVKTKKEKSERGLVF